MPTLPVPITSPLKGVVRAVSREGQPPETCWDAMNCLPYDRYGRKRLSQRPGLAKQFASGGGAFVQGMIEAPNIIYPPNPLTVPVWSITKLPSFPGMITTPGTLGPYAYNGPTTLGFTLQWQWDFTIGETFTATNNNNTFWQTSNPAGTLVVYFPMTGIPSQDLVLSLKAGGTMGTTGSGMSATVQINATAPSVPNGGVLLGTSTVLFPASCTFPGTAPATNSFTISQNFSLILTSSGSIQLLTAGFPGQTINATYPYGGFLFPQLNVQSWTQPAYNAGLDNNIVSATSRTMTVTD